jgi:integrase
MGVIHKGKKWVADCFLGKHFKPQRIRVVFKTKNEAKLFHAEVMYSLENNLPIPKSNKIKSIYTLEKLFSNVHKQFYNDETNLSTLSKMKLITDVLGKDLPVNMIRYKHLERVKDYLINQRKVSNATVNRYNAVMSKSLKYAVKIGELELQPKLEQLKESKGRLSYLSYEDEAKILEYLQVYTKEFCDFVAFLIDTGLRWRSEALKISIKDFNEKDNSLHVYGSKNDLERTVYLTDRAANILKKYNRFIFKDHQVRFWWNQVRIHLDRNDQDFVPHICRHTCASRLVQKGVPLTVVMKWMGHKSMQTTLRYAHLCDKNLEQARDILQSKNVVTLK